MSGFLLDTNVLSELRKKSRADAKIVKWIASLPDDELYVSVLTLGEIRKGIERARSTDPAKASSLEQWLLGLESAFADHIIPINTAVAYEWGRISSVRPLPPIDALLAATAFVFNHTLVTRNTHDIHDTGVKFINPFSL